MLPQASGIDNLSLWGGDCGIGRVIAFVGFLETIGRLESMSQSLASSIGSTKRAVVLFKKFATCVQRAMSANNEAARRIFGISHGE